MVEYPPQLLLFIWHLPWHWLLAALHTAVALLAAGHALVYKRDPRAALGWVTFCLLFPLVGPLLYYLFGINRIRGQAHRLADERPLRRRIDHERGTVVRVVAATPDDLPPALTVFADVSNRLCSRPIVPGNRVTPLHNGEAVYPAMLAAIERATHRVLLASYLFESDTTGRAFVAALAAAKRRGVEVHVLVDGVGELYSWPRISALLRQAGVPVARFLPPHLLPPSLSINLRNHRKVLVVDGREGFTGGMNIGNRHLVHAGGGTVDMHFHLQGPVVAQLEEVFRGDWHFATGEWLPAGPAAPPVGSDHCRTISDGPNEDLDKISLILMGAISAAREEIVIITPYFLPSREMIAALQSAALRSVDVSIILPARSNLRYIDWATRNLLWELLQYGVKVWYQPPPFAHTKLFVVDSCYAQIGSANLDPRSLRLNFELNLELFAPATVRVLAQQARELRSRATPVTLEEVDNRSLPVRLRDAFFWLFTPYL